MKLFQHGELSSASSEASVWKTWTEFCLRRLQQNMKQLNYSVFHWAGSVAFTLTKNPFHFWYKIWQNFKIINVSRRFRRPVLKNKKKINLCIIPKNIVVKLFLATSVHQGCFETVARRVWEWMKEVNYVLSSAFQISVFFLQSLKSQTEGAVSRLCSAPVAFFQRSMFNWWTLSGWECTEGYLQSVSASLIWINLCPF